MDKELMCLVRLEVISLHSRLNRGWEASCLNGRMVGDIQPRKGRFLGQSWPPEDSSEGPETPY